MNQLLNYHFVFVSFFSGIIINIRLKNLYSLNLLENLIINSNMKTEKKEIFQ